MQRYQKKSYDNIFLRWVYHLSDWIEVSRKYSNILLVNYKDLNTDYNSTLSNVFEFIELPKNKFSRPSRDSYINTKQLDLQINDNAEFISFINKNLSLYPNIETIFKIKS